MDDNRKYLKAVLASGLELEILSAEDIFSHISMETLANHLPVVLKAKLLTVCMEAKAMDASVVLDAVGMKGIVENIPTHYLWECIEEAGNKVIGVVNSSSSLIKIEAPKQSLTKRKPNHRARTETSKVPENPAEVALYDGDTKVGEELLLVDSDVLDESGNFRKDEVTIFGEEVILD